MEKSTSDRLKARQKYKRSPSKDKMRKKRSAEMGKKVSAKRVAQRSAAMKDEGRSMSELIGACQEEQIDAEYEALDEGMNSPLGAQIYDVIVNFYVRENMPVTKARLAKAFKGLLGDFEYISHDVEKERKGT